MYVLSFLKLRSEEVEKLGIILHFQFSIYLKVIADIDVETGIPTGIALPFRQSGE